MSNRLIFLSLSAFFVLFSFSPSLYEIYSYASHKIPLEREFVLEHNYMFDYNFYLSRIREGQEGRWTVVEKYYNDSHNGSLIQEFYLLIGKLGGFIGLTPPAIYHLARLIFGFIFLMMIAGYLEKLFPRKWAIVGYFFIVTAGSFPALVRAGFFWRFATYMGWWSVIDSLQRITFIPHILVGQIGLLWLVLKLSNPEKNYFGWMVWGIVGFLIGVVFPPTLIVVYTILVVLSLLELVEQYKLLTSAKLLKSWVVKRIFPRVMFFILSVPALVYLNFIFQIMPWKALSLFDIQHRFIFPYKDYILALGPMLPLGLMGLIFALIKKEKKLLPAISWLVALFLLFKIFENFPQQSPLRFTEAAINIPLGILTTYFFISILRIFGNLNNSLLRKILPMGVFAVITVIILLGLGVMLSMVGWLTDQAYAKRVGNWLVPLGAELIYPPKDFMEGVYYLRDKGIKNSVVLGYITAGNYIPAYAGNFVYIGHANTPNEDGKEIIAARFFKGEMGNEEAWQFLKTNHIAYVFLGPQESELGGINDFGKFYSFLLPIYKNKRVTIYRVNR